MSTSAIHFSSAPSSLVLDGSLDGWSRRVKNYLPTYSTAFILCDRLYQSCYKMGSYIVSSCLFKLCSISSLIKLIVPHIIEISLAEICSFSSLTSHSKLKIHPLSSLSFLPFNPPHKSKPAALKSPNVLLANQPLPLGVKLFTSSPSAPSASLTNT